MRVLRSTLYAPDLSPMTTVVRESDVIDTLESIRLGVPQPGCFVVSDLFELDGDHDIVVVTTAAMTRMEQAFDDERNMAIMFYWATAQFQLIHDQGTVFMPEPAPLSEQQVRTVFEQIVNHPDYTRQQLRAAAQDGTEVFIDAGEVK